MFDFPLPDSLSRLLATGVWPSAKGPLMTEQQLHPIIPSDRVRIFAAEETLICLMPPPFHTIARERAAGGAGDFWERFGALDQIVPERALVIADFGIGADSVVVLYYADASRLSASSSTPPKSKAIQPPLSLYKPFKQPINATNVTLSSWLGAVVP